MRTGRWVWRVAARFGYGYGMGKRRTTVPETRLSTLDQWEGLWVAVKDGVVIAAAHSSRDLVPELRKMGVKGEGAVAQFVTPRSGTIMIGVG